ncbi:hypothetical protein DWX23_18890 [Parabacteroides sp. AF18-52]|jgi:lipoprotein|uniref:hypothetical protein n=1 Tax=Parabacteroides sp. AF18-52 TaxID=2292242 RepID=UPI000F00FFC8|nr:hypothetical protein [Parabacteroides sp. AF18-52]RHR37409.1 hypothetical protein DWX23_18890 [Parabacteroides sp. AF18-52]
MRKELFLLLIFALLLSCNNQEKKTSSKCITNSSGLYWIQSQIVFVEYPNGEEKPYWSGLWVTDGETVEVETDLDYFYVKFLDEEYYYRQTKLIPFIKGKGTVKYDDILEEKVHQSQSNK